MLRRFIDTARNSSRSDGWAIIWEEE